MKKLERNLLFVLFCQFMLPVAQAQNDVPSHAIDGEYIKEWLVLGPFFPDDLEKDFLVDVGGEANIEHKEGDTFATAQGDTLTWKRYQTQGSLIELLHVVGSYEHAVTYAFCTLRSEAEGKVQILLGSDDGASVWINGKKVHHNPVYRSLTFDDDMFEVDFLKGANRCLVKVSQATLDWRFAMRAFPHNQPVLVTPKFFLSSDHLTDEIWLPTLYWKYHHGDNEEWASPEFDDSEWEITSTWLRPNKLPKSGWDGIGWFRLHLAADSTLWNRPLALNVMQGGASEIYLDGRLVAQFGKVGSTKHDEEGYFAMDPDLLPPPKSILFNKANHVIAVRFSDFYLTEKYPYLRQGLQIILSDLNSTIASSAGQRRANTIIQMVLTIVPVVFAILHLLLFLFYQRAKENLYFALFTLMLGAWLFAAWQTIFSPVTDLRQALLFQKLIPGIGAFAFISGLRFLYALFYPRLPKQFWIFLLIVACYATLEWGSPFREPEFYIGIIAATIPLEILRVAVVAIWRKKDGSWIIGTGFIFFVVTSMSGVLYVNFELANKAIAPLLLLSGLFGLLLSMSVFLARNISRTEVDNARKTHELEEARKLQLSMLPATIPTHPNLEIAVFMQTATEVGGDYYDFHYAENGTLTIAIGDATGHGMQAGTMVAATKSLFNSLADEPEPVQVLKKGTKAIKAMGLRKMFMALTIAKFKDHQMHVSAAGMPFTLVYRASTGQVEELELKGLPLGVLLDFNFQEKKLQLNDGDTVLFLSDGFEEMFNQQNEIMGDDKAKEHFEEVATSSPDEIIEHLKKAGMAWAGGSAQRDDVTFVVVKIKQ